MIGYGASLCTHSGRQAFPLLRQWRDFDIDDIAHALGHTCRFLGHTSRFYSVAEHCVLVSYLCPHALRLDGLLHDMSEAYLGDIPTPLKDYMPEYRDAEEQLMMSMCSVFNVTFPLPEAVRIADRRALCLEVSHLMPVTSMWDLPPPSEFDEFCWRRVRATMKAVRRSGKRAFLERYKILERVAP